MRQGLERIEGLLDALGRPEQRYRLVQVGGTNGKGSVAAMLAAILKAAGHRVGLYTSPHLVSFRERVRVDGEPIPEDGVVDGVEALGTLVARFDATMFEATTALALDHFAREAVDVAVLEVGLGGGPGGQRLTCAGRGWSLAGLELGMPGSFQPSNALLAVTAARELGVREPAIRDGLARAWWPGRFQIIRHARGFLVLDGAHNPAGASALATSLREVFADTRVTFVLGILRDKDAPGIVAALAPVADRFVLVASSNPRATAPDTLRALVPASVTRVDVAGSPVEALALAVRTAAAPIVCVAGSLSLIGDVLRHLGGSDKPCSLEKGADS